MSDSIPPKLSNLIGPARVLVSECPNCKQQIEFDATGVNGNEVVALECPHCQNETKVTVPPTEEEIAHAQAEAERANAERLLIQQVNQIKDSMRTRLQNGKPVFLYESIYIPVDSVVNGENLAEGFSLTLLRQLGLLGWDVVQTVSKTVGVALQNVSFGSTMGDSWGAGMGGNVMGVHLVIKKSLSFSDLTDDPHDEVGQFIQSHLDDFLPP